MERIKILSISGDIISVLELGKGVGWEGVRKTSLNRILYLSSVLYSFVYKRQVNPFVQDYKFGISIRGPYFEGLENAITYLQSNFYLLEDKKEDVYKLGGVQFNGLENIRNYHEKREWINIIIYILAIYGEEKIYDFIFRDPEYQNKLQTNSIREINIDVGNETHKTLMKFKEAFEETLDNKNMQINAKTYLKLYFEYIFSTMIKGE